MFKNIKHRRFIVESLYRRGPAHVRVLAEISVTVVRNAPRFWTKYIQSVPELRLVYISTVVTPRSHTRSLKV